MGRQQLANRGKRQLDVRVVGHANQYIQLPQGANVMQDLADDLAIGDDDVRMIRVAQYGAEQVHALNRAFLIGNGNILADLKRPGENDRESRRQIPQHPLHRECDARACNPQPRQQGQ